MPRIRSIKPEWLEDENLAACSDTARMMSVALITLADDYGNGRAHPMFLGSRIWPYSEDLGDVARRLSAGLGELAEGGFIQLYDVKNQSYFHIINWDKHQRIDNAGKPHVPKPDEADEPTDEEAEPVRGDLPPDLDLDLDQDLDPDRGQAAGGSDSDPSPRQVLEEFASIFTGLTGRREFTQGIDACTAGQLEYLRNMRDSKGGDTAAFRALVSALMAEKPDFYSKQGLRYWAETAMNSPLKPPASAPTNAPAYHQEWQGDNWKPEA